MSITNIILDAVALATVDPGGTVPDAERCSRSRMTGHVAARTEREQGRRSAASSSSSTSGASSSVSVSSSSSVQSSGRSRARAMSSTTDATGRRITVIDDERGCRVIVEDSR